MSAITQQVEPGWKSWCYIAEKDGVEVDYIHINEAGSTEVSRAEWREKMLAAGATIRVSEKHFP